MKMYTDNTTHQIVRMIDAPRKRVYAAWTDTELASQWLGTDGAVTDDLILLPEVRRVYVL